MSDQYPDGFYEHLEVYDNPDAPDGAWQAMIEDGVSAYNKEYNTLFDEFDGWMWYITEKGNRQQ